MTVDFTAGLYIETKPINPKDKAVDSGLRILREEGFVGAKLGYLTSTVGCTSHGTPVIYWPSPDELDMLVAWAAWRYDPQFDRNILAWWCGPSISDQLGDVIDVGPVLGS